MRQLAIILTLILFLGLFYFGIKNFNTSAIFWFDETAKTNATVTDAKFWHFGKGFYYQELTYEYEIDGKTYTDKHNVGRQQGKKHIGDKLHIEYSTSSPEKNNVIGYYKSESNLRIKATGKKIEVLK